MFREVNYLNKPKGFVSRALLPAQVKPVLRVVELEATYQVDQNLRFSLGGAYTNAELSEDAPGIGGVSGDRLPSSPSYSFNLGLLYEFEMAGYPSFVSGDYAYVGEFFNRLGETGVETGDYGELNISAGVDITNVSIEFFAKNLTNEDALTHADVAVFDDRAYQLRPRTIGLQLRYCNSEGYL